MVQNSQLKNIKTTSRILLLLSVPLLAVGIFLLIRTVTFITNAVEAEATVIANELHRGDGNGGDTYSPTFKFITSNGTDEVVKLKISSSEYNYKVGEQVKIQYLPENPQTVRVANFLGIWGVTLIITVLGVGLLGFYFVLRIAEKKLGNPLPVTQQDQDS